jgi:molybdopterin/thiamine biosynthesis adenylyltransferase
MWMENGGEYKPILLVQFNDLRNSLLRIYQGLIVSAIALYLCAEEEGCSKNIDFDVLC